MHRDPGARVDRDARRTGERGASTQSDAAGREGRAPRDGLGLAICKGLVEAHGGRIRSESAGPGRGTTVVFVVPFEFPKVAAVPRRRLEAGGEDSTEVRPGVAIPPLGGE